MSKKTIVQVTRLDAGHQDEDTEEKEILGLEPLKMVSFGLLTADNDITASEASSLLLA